MLKLLSSSLAAATVFFVFRNYFILVQAVCDELYSAASDATISPLVCESFPGDPTLHAILYGCDSLNQNEAIPEGGGYVSQSFTQKCTASIGFNTTYICYEMASDTDYTGFLDEVMGATSIQCAADDQFESPAYMYQQTNASFEFSGAAGSQETGGAADFAFQPDLAAGAYYVVTIKEGQALTYNPTAAPGSDGGGDDASTTPPEDTTENVLDEVGATDEGYEGSDLSNGDNTTTAPSENDGDGDGDDEGTDSSSLSIIQHKWKKTFLSFLVIAGYSSL